MYVSLLVYNNGRQFTGYVKATSDQVVVTKARGLHDDLRQQDGVARRRQQQLERVTAVRGVPSCLD